MPKPRRIVYVEDNAANLALVQKVLQHDGAYEVIGAATGEAGLQEVRRCQPALILLDLDLPQMTGFEFITAIAKEPPLAETPIVAISASVMKQERQQALDAGCVYFIEKPFDIGELREVVAAAIEARL